MPTFSNRWTSSLHVLGGGEGGGVSAVGTRAIVVELGRTDEAWVSQDGRSRVAGEVDNDETTVERKLRRTREPWDEWIDCKGDGQRSSQCKSKRRRVIEGWAHFGVELDAKDGLALVCESHDSLLVVRHPRSDFQLIGQT